MRERARERDNWNLKMITRRFSYFLPFRLAVNSGVSSDRCKRNYTNNTVHKTTVRNISFIPLCIYHTAKAVFCCRLSTILQAAQISRI